MFRMQEWCEVGWRNKQGLIKHEQMVTHTKAHDDITMFI